MTAYYVRSGASGSANGTSWANAYTTLTAALSGKAAGDDFFCAEDHSESSTSVTLTFPGTNANPNRVFCVDHNGSVPPVSADLRTSAVIATSSGDIALAGAGSYIYGIQFKPGSSGRPLVSNGASGLMVLERCLLAPQGGGQIIFNNSGITAKTRLIDCDLTFGTTGGSLRLSNKIEMVGGSIAATGSVPTTLINLSGVSSLVALFDGVDLSAFGSGTTLMGNGTGIFGHLTLRNSKLGASVTPAATPSGIGAPFTDIVNCDSGATNYRNERYDYLGTLTTETTIVRSGGASDGTTPVSHKIVTTANSKWPQPFESFPLAIWNDTVGSTVTATVYGIWGGGAVPNNDDIWIEAEYLGSSGSPQASFATGGKADGLASNAALSSDASSWGGSTTAFKMAVTFTPQQKGLIYVTVKAAKASSTFYVDPKIELS